MKMQWKRVEAGHYQSGDWHIKGVRTTWDLYKSQTHVYGPCRSKAECQKAAEGKGPTIVGAEPPPTAALRPKSTTTDLDSVLSSLRLEIDQLSGRVGSIDATVNKLADAVLVLSGNIHRLTKAVKEGRDQVVGGRPRQKGDEDEDEQE